MAGATYIPEEKETETPKKKKAPKPPPKPKRFRQNSKDSSLLMVSTDIYTCI